MVDTFSPQASLIGVKLGKYAVQALIGRGAMATVYLAKDMDLGRPVALKVLLGSMARNPEQVRRFQMEALAAAPLQHPNIVRIYDAGTISGVPFISMEYVEGEPLERLLQRMGPLPWQHALQITRQLAEALDCAHRAGIIHRDVKPANVLLDNAGRVRLTDFGIANIAHRRHSPAPDEAFLGTPEYMSPEQCAGSADVAPSTDLFSLGVTLFRMIAGQMPFQGNNTVTLIKSIAEDTPPRLNQLNESVPDDVARLAAHLLEKERHQRPASARWVCEQISRLLRDNGGSSALPEALNAFMREQSQPRKSRTDTPTPHKGSRGPKIEFVERKKYYAPVSALAKGLAAALLLFAALGVGYWHVLRGDVPVQAAEEVPGAAFTEAQPGTWTAALPADHWTAASLHWAGSSQRLLVLCDGARGTLAQGARGVLAYDLDGKAVYSVDAPSGPGMNNDHWAARPGGAWLGALPATAPGALLDGCYVQPVYSDAPGGPQVLLLPHAATAAAPRRQPLFACEPLEWALPPAAPGETPWAGQAAISPAGNTICLLIRNLNDGSTRLIEHDARQGTDTRNARPLTSTGDPIVPGTVQYAPSGGAIAFLRERGNGDRALWILDPGSGDAMPVAVGNLGKEAAFSPDSALIAVNIETPEGPRVALASTADGTIVARLGAGRVSQESWHPSGRYLVITAEDERLGSPQLIAVSAGAPHTRQPLTAHEAGVLLGGAVSRDGRWAAGALATGELIFVDLSTPAGLFQPDAPQPSLSQAAAPAEEGAA